MKRVNSKPADMRLFACPQCDKRRMVRKPDHVVSLEKEEVIDKNNESIHLLTDVCEFCLSKNHKKHFEPTKAEIRKIINAMSGNLELKGKSLEDIL